MSQDAVMPEAHTVGVYLCPTLVPASGLREGVVVVIDVLRATTTMIHALAAGCEAIFPCATIPEAQTLATALPPVVKVLLAGERQGAPLPGFDLGNSPRECTEATCRGTTLVMTTSNGTQAILRALTAERAYLAAFVNYSAVCERLKAEKRPVYVLCAGDGGAVALEDALLAGAIVHFLAARGESSLDDGARLAQDCFLAHGRSLEAALRLGSGGVRLRALGYDEDIHAAAQVDAFHFVPEVRLDPIRVIKGVEGEPARHWPWS
jgi:2-phosphosulfolactate phosphatase